MHHYFEAITNTSGDSLVGYFGRVINRTNNNTVTLASDDNGTPIIVVSGVENMAKTDDFGNLDFYVEPGTYDLEIYAPNATSLIMRVPNVAMNSSKGDRGDPGPEGPQGEVSTLQLNTAIGQATTSIAQGNATLGFKGKGPSVVRSLQQLVDEGLDLVKDFAANGNGTTNNSTAIASAFSEAVGNGFELLVPAGVFAFDTPVNVTLTASLFNSQRGACLKGVGPATRLLFTGANTADAVTVTGTHPGLDKFTVCDMGVHRPNTPLGFTLTGAGLRLRKMVGAEVRNISLYNHGIGLALDGVLASNFFGVSVAYCRRAGLFTYFNISGPNVLNFVGTKFTSNDDGVEIQQGCGINFVGCTFEGTGADRWNRAVSAGNESEKLAAANSAALRLTNCGREGGQIVSMPGSYFEAGRGYDIDISHSDFSARYETNGGIFNRFTEATRSTYDRPIIRFSDSGTGTTPGNDAIIDLNGMTVRRYGYGGTVAIPDATTPVLAIDQSSVWPRLTVMERDVLYSSAGNNNNPNWQTTVERTNYGTRNNVRRDSQPADLAMSNGWVATVDPALRIMRNLDGRVTFEGTVQNGTSADATVILTLPVGFRPTRLMEFVCRAQTGPCFIRVRSDNGAVQVFGASGSAFVYLSGISFLNY